MDTKSLENLFREIAWMLNPFYKFLVLVVYVGGPLMALFVLLLAYTSPNTTIWIAVIIVASLIIGFKLGPAAFFLVNSSWIYFRFDKVGIWLPILCYTVVAITLALQMAANRVLTPGNE